VRPRVVGKALVNGDHMGSKLLKEAECRTAYTYGIARLEVRSLITRARTFFAPSAAGKARGGCDGSWPLCRQASANQKWITDFTYIWTAEGWLYVSAVIDLYSRRVDGWSMTKRNWLLTLC
jgi:transposase InsO family protein